MQNFHEGMAVKIFRLYGCGVLWKMEMNEEMTLEEALKFKCKPRNTQMEYTAKTASALGDILGDDIDGLASLMDGY